MAVRIEEIEATLNVRQRTLAMIEQHHGIVLFGDLDAALVANGASWSDDARQRHDRFGRAQKTRQRGEVIHAEVRQAPSSFFIKEGGPIRSRMAVVRMGSGDSAERSAGE